MKSIHEWRKVVFQEMGATPAATPVTTPTMQGDPLAMLGQFMTNSAAGVSKLPPALLGPYNALNKAWTTYQSQIKTTSATPQPAATTPIASAAGR